jgi:hypothetical protein
MTNHPLSIYLEDCLARRKTGATTPETSLYNPLETLLNAVGSKLKKPRVRCFMNLKDQDAGLPDGGLFTPDQFEKGNEETPQGQTPSRGVIECKPPKKDVVTITDTEQVSKYWDRYNQVLVTNYREFALIGRDGDKPVRHEFYRLAASEKEFWNLASHPESAVKAHGDRLLDFLQRCLLRPAPLTEPKDDGSRLHQRRVNTNPAEVPTFGESARSASSHRRACFHGFAFYEDPSGPMDSRS